MVDVVELRTEKLLNMLRVSAVGLGGGCASTGLNSLKPADVAAALGMVKDVRHRLALEVRAGLGDERESVELRQLIRQNLAVFSFGKALDMRSSKQRLKLDRVSCCAIERLAGVERKKGEKANCMGIDRRNYHRVWESREEEVYKILLQWAIDGDKALNTLLSERFKVA